MTDFDRPYEDHINGNYPEPGDFKNDKKFKLILIAGLFIALVLAMLDNAGYFGYWWE